MQQFSVRTTEPTQRRKTLVKYLFSGENVSVLNEHGTLLVLKGGQVAGLFPAGTWTSCVEGDV